MPTLQADAPKAVDTKKTAGLSGSNRLGSGSGQRFTLAKSVVLRLGIPYLALLTLMYGNELIGSLTHLSFTLASPAVYFFTNAEFRFKWYALCIFVGFIYISFLASRRAHLWGLAEGQVLSAALWALNGGALGARLYFVTLCLPYFLLHPEKIFSSTSGGLSIHGCMLGIILSLSIYTKIYKLSLLSLIDLAATVLPLGQAIWRWGNFFNSEAFGAPLSREALLKVAIPTQDRPAAYRSVEYFHPTFLYEFFWDLTLFAFLYFVAAKHLRHRPGMLSSVYLAGYSAGRLVIELFRLDSIKYGSFSVPLFVTTCCLIGGVITSVVLSRKHAVDARS
ncbi:MAG TPA: prolipoprotein diacylglyceryl transferase [Candidatus Obscuribacterales bacterium]